MPVKFQEDLCIFPVEVTSTYESISIVEGVLQRRLFEMEFVDARAAKDSPTDSTLASASRATSLALEKPVRCSFSLMMPSNCRLVTRRSRNAASAHASPTARGSAQATSRSVLATDVTRRPSTVVGAGSNPTRRR